MSEQLQNPGNAAPAKKKGKGGRIAGAVVGGLVLLAGGTYAAGYAMAGEKLPANTSIDGIPIGGLTRPEAADRLNAEYLPRVNKPIRVNGPVKSVEIDPTNAGLSIDVQRTVEEAGGEKSFDPRKIWNVLSGGGPIAPVLAVDNNKLTEAVGVAASELNRDPKDATVLVKGTQIEKTDGEQAIELRQDELVKKLKASYPTKTEVEAPVKMIDPNITTDEADEVIKSYINPSISAPLKVDTGKGVFEISTEDIGNSTKVVEKDGKLVGQTDAEKLYTEVQPAVKKLNFKKAKDAEYSFSGSSVTVVPAVDGEELNKENFNKSVIPAVPKTDSREVKVEITPRKPKLTTEDAEKQKPKEVIGEFTTYYPHADYRNTNLGIAAQRINGHTVPVGEVFSLDEALGKRSSYVDGWVVSGGKMVKESGGGISQSATTAFNAGWFAGLEDVEHQPHTLYFDRYPAGREATMYSGSIDMKFRNTTDNAIYIQSSNVKSSPGSKGSITVKIWGTKKWDIESPEPTKSGYYNGGKRYDTSASCNPQSASPGFTASYYRLFKQNGQVVKRENKTWKYSAADEIVCGPKPSAAKPADNKPADNKPAAPITPAKSN